MRLLKIGRNPACDIVLQNPRVSDLHAELTVLNNGDILIEDKGSTNGTFIMGKPIPPYTQVPISRGTSVQLGDFQLPWTQVPASEDLSQCKALYGIGTNFHNEFKLEGKTVSRFHATIKQEKNKKVYIQDHSTNGTTVNGRKITPHQYVPLRRRDAVVCGGVPVSSNELNNKIDWPRPIWKYLSGVAAALALVISIYYLLPPKPVPITALQDATELVYGEYWIDVTLDDNPMYGVINGWPETFRFGQLITKKGAQIVPLLLKMWDSDLDIQPIAYTGTAFFISPHGELGTNRHIACPWLYQVPEEQIRHWIEMFINTYEQRVVQLLISSNLSSKDAEAYYSRFKKAKIKEISGHHEFLGIAYTGTKVESKQDFKRCQVIADSGDPKRDVALIRLHDLQTPEKIIKNGFFDITKIKTEIVSNMQEVVSIGYPAGLMLTNIMADGKEIRPTTMKAWVSKEADSNMFQIQLQSQGGASGSPIVDADTHQLIGVLWGGIENHTAVCNIKHLADIYSKHKYLSKE